MNRPLPQIAGWSALLKVMVIVVELAAVVLLASIRQSVTTVGYIFAIVESLLTFPLILALFKLLPPYASGRAKYASVLGALGYLGGILLRILLLAHLISEQDGLNALQGAIALQIAWLLDLNWEMWRVALLKGALPWIGIAYAILWVVGIVPSSYVSTLIRFGAASGLVILEITWYTWLGILLIRDKVNAYA